MEEKERNFYDRFKDVVSAYVFHDPNAQAATAMDILSPVLVSAAATRRA